jgi:hypothetical protein
LFAPTDKWDASFKWDTSLVGKTPPFRDARKAKRHKVHHPAWVLLDSRRAPIECVIKDMSDSGARLELASLIRSVPLRFTLWLDKNGKVQRSCEVVWRRAYSVGVRFEARDRKLR